MTIPVETLHMDTTCKIKFTLAAFLIGAIVTGTPAANAQGYWQTQLESSIQHYVGTGLLKSSQAADLRSREAKLEDKRLQLLARNGGVLTPSDRDRLLQQSEDLGQRLQNYLRRNGYRTASGVDTWMRNLIANELPIARATYPRHSSQRPVFANNANGSCAIPSRGPARNYDRSFNRFYR